MFTCLSHLAKEIRSYLVDERGYKPMVSKELLPDGRELEETDPIHLVKFLKDHMDKKSQEDLYNKLSEAYSDLKEYCR